MLTLRRMLDWNQIIEGEIILVDKPQGWSSFDVVKRIKGLFYRLNKTKLKIGHAGTLDPLATGLMVICTGKKTKIIEGFLHDDKSYSGIIYLGAETASYDLESEPENFKDISHITAEEIQKTAASFIGEQEQYPPAHSAVKINGKRAYKMARQGLEVEIKPRLVNIKKFDILQIDKNEIHFYITSSKGTYIRSIASDFGKKLGCGAYLKYLRREKSGDFSVENARQMDALLDEIQQVFQKHNESPDLNG